MATFTVNRKQSLVDVCLQLYGSTQFLFKLAKDNGLFIDSDLSRGSVLTYDSLLGNPDVKLVTESQGLKMVNPGVDLGLTVMDFDGASYVTLSSNPSLAGTRSVWFSLYLDISDYGTSGMRIFSLGIDAEDDHLVAILYSGQLRFFASASTGGPFVNRAIDITGFINKEIRIQVDKSITSIDAVYVNDINQSLISLSAAANVSSTSIIGGSSGNPLNNATVWNINNNNENIWPGTGPNANTDAAWVDSVGGINGTVVGSPETRIIS